ncbi:MAG: LytR C-terminal domain-containing protein [Patescibacteria group bacterium]
MGRVWDILPPQKRPQKHTPKRTKKSKNASLFLLFLISGFVIIFMYATSQNKLPDTNKITTTNTPQSQTSTEKKVLIKVLNGTGKGEETTKVTQLIEDLGLKVIKTENALNLYDQTIVYFSPGKEEIAQKIADELTAYQAKIQAFTQESPYDVVVVIGGK